MARLPIVDSNNWVAANRYKNHFPKRRMKTDGLCKKMDKPKKVFREGQKPDLRVVNTQTIQGRS